MNAELHTPTAPASVLATPSLNQIRYTVTVKPDSSGGATFLYNGEPGPLVINVQESEAVIQFILDVSSGEHVWNPINWYSDGLVTSIDRPKIMAVTRESEKTVTILDDNTSPGEQRFHFTLSVLLNGTVYTSHDPTIINSPVGELSAKALRANVEPGAGQRLGRRAGWQTRGSRTTGFPPRP